MEKVRVKQLLRRINVQFPIKRLFLMFQNIDFLLDSADLVQNYPVGYEMEK